MTYLSAFVGITLISYTLAYSGEYVPKSYYLLGEDGHQSEVIFFRSKRAVELFPLLRKKRGGGSQSSASASSFSSGSNAGSGAHSSASSYSSSNSGSNGYHPELVDPGFSPDFYNLANGHLQSFAPPDSSGFSGASGYGDVGGDSGYHGPILFSRFGEAEGTGVKVSGNAAGPRAAYSSSSSSIDSNGKIKYSVQSGKY